MFVSEEERSSSESESDHSEEEREQKLLVLQNQVQMVRGGRVTPGARYWMLDGVLAGWCGVGPCVEVECCRVGCGVMGVL